MKKYFAENLRYLRKKRKLSQNDIAVIVKKTNKTVSAWEKGIREPLVEDVYVLSIFFGVSIESLYFADLRK